MSSSKCVVSSREPRPGERCGTPGCILVAHLSGRRRAAASRWRCASCGRFTPTGSPDRCLDCSQENPIPSPIRIAAAT